MVNIKENLYKLLGRAKRITLIQACLGLLSSSLLALIILGLYGNEWQIVSGLAKAPLELEWKFLAALLAAIAVLWRLQVSKEQSDESVYLSALVVLKDMKTQAGYTGASYQLLHLAEKNIKYIVPATLIIESAIRDLSEITFVKWMEHVASIRSSDMNNKKDRDFSPAIKDMVVIVMQIRHLAKKYAVDVPDINFRRADLRGLRDDDFKGVSNWRESLLRANLNHADLRNVHLDLCSETCHFEKTYTVAGAWVGTSRKLLEGKEHSFGSNLTLIKLEKGFDEDQGLKKIEPLLKKGALLFLTGAYSLSPGPKVKGQNFVFQMRDSTESINCAFGGAPGINLSNMDLSNCDFSNSYLVGANFKKANLKGAKFTFADIRFSDFSGANLENATFVGVKYTDALFSVDKEEKADVESESEETYKDEDLKQYFSLLQDRASAHNKSLSEGLQNSLD